VGATRYSRHTPLERILTHPTPSSNPFVDPTEADPSLEQRPPANVSGATMQRLRTPFDVQTTGQNDDRDDH